jgi:hypothetical protein
VGRLEPVSSPGPCLLIREEVPQSQLNLQSAMRNHGAFVPNAAQCSGCLSTIRRLPALLAAVGLLLVAALLVAATLLEAT